MLEYLVKWNDVHQHFLKTPFDRSTASSRCRPPGIGMELDETKIEERVELRW